MFTAQVVGVMAVQIAMAYVVKDAPWWKVLVAAYVVSGTCSQNLFTAQHELSHFLAFRKPLYNRILSLASNCPLVVPMATSFRKYHQEHHSHLVRPFKLQHHMFCSVSCDVCTQTSCLCEVLHAAGKLVRRGNFCATMSAHQASVHEQGVDGWDVDLPTYLEANYITGVGAKVAWVLVYIVVYGLRPVLIRPKPIGEPSSVMHSLYW